MIPTKSVNEFGERLSGFARKMDVEAVGRVENASLDDDKATRMLERVMTEIFMLM